MEIYIRGRGREGAKEIERDRIYNISKNFDTHCANYEFVASTLNSFLIAFFSFFGKNGAGSF